MTNDHFSRQAAAYANFRPRYPAELFAFVAAQAPERESVWDCGCGSGQASEDLARHFRRVLATDPSLQQIGRAPRRPGLFRLAATAEAAPLPERSVDAVFVGQAQHWFDTARFYGEVDRVVRPGGILAVTAYGLLRVSPAVDPLLDRFYTETVGPYWPPERRHLDTAYREIPFPYPRIPSPELAMNARWQLDHLLGYLRSWSAVQHCLDATGRDPVSGLERSLLEVWGPPETVRKVSWPLLLRVGRVKAQT